MGLREGWAGEEPRGEVRGDWEDPPPGWGSWRRERGKSDTLAAWDRTGCEGERRVEAEGLAGGGAQTLGVWGGREEGTPSHRTGTRRWGYCPRTPWFGVWILLGSAFRWTTRWSPGLYFGRLCPLTLLPSLQGGVALQETPVCWGPGLLLRGA